MKTKTSLILASLCGVTLLTAGCSSSCPTGPHTKYEHQHKKHDKKQKKAEPVVFQQNYGSNDVNNVHAKMFTRSVNGGTSEMGYIKFNETDDGLKMNVDLIDLRPGKTYTAQVYQCWSCNASVCCNTEAMNIDLPQIKISETGRLQQSYIIRGLTASQLNNAQLVLTRDGGYKAAWGQLNQ